MIATTQVRNVGSWAGNLMTFLRYKSFPSDSALVLTTVDARLQLCDAYGTISSMTMQQFLNASFDDFVNGSQMIVSATFYRKPPQAVGFNPRTGLPLRVCAETFRVAQRARNAHAHINAGDGLYSLFTFCVF